MASGPPPRSARRPKASFKAGSNSSFKSLILLVRRGRMGRGTAREASGGGAASDRAEPLHHLLRRWSPSPSLRDREDVSGRRLCPRQAARVRPEFLVARQII